MQAMPLGTNSNGLYDVEIRMRACFEICGKGSGCHAEKPESPSSKVPNHT